ncbi:GNAT family N-acetyltransferase [Bacteroidota bacterium]
MEIQVLTSVDNASLIIKDKIADFLYKNLEESSDELASIHKCLDYALSPYRHQGGFVLFATEKNKILGAVVVNHTNMEDYVPENLLVYIAVHHKHRKKGIGRKLLSKALEYSHGDMALHVKHNNPAIKLYEDLGFEQKYVEMRRMKKS